MKKTYIYIICFFILIIALILGKYYDYKNKKAELDKFNLEYAQFTQRDIYGTELATVINKAVNNNETNKIEKKYIENENNKYYSYIPNDINSIKIDIKITDNNMTYSMESLYQGEITRFVQYYNSIMFNCTEIKYNKAGRVSYMLFEQVSK